VSELAPVIVLTVAIAAGECLALLVGEPGPLPLSYACYPVAAVLLGAGPYGLTIALGTAAGVLLSRVRVAEGARRFAVRVVVAAAVLGAYHGVFDVLGRREETAIVLVALGAAALAAVVADEAARRLLHRCSAFAGRGAFAWLALGSSGALMALGAHGVDGRGALGLWGAALFAMPLAAAWYSFARLDGITRIATQTIDALSLAPELGGFVPTGHATRVAAVAASIGDRVDLSPAELRALDIAARLHDLGAVTLDDDPLVLDAADVSKATGEMLRDVVPLAAPRSIIEGDAGTASEVLRVSHAYTALAGTDDAGDDAALAALRSAPVDAYDPVVVDALAVVVGEGGGDRRRRDRPRLRLRFQRVERA
jgi:hypothetical protein